MADPHADMPGMNAEPKAPKPAVAPTTPPQARKSGMADETEHHDHHPETKTKTKTKTSTGTGTP